MADVFVPLLAALPGPGELVATDDFLVQPGGCAANVAIGLATLGVPAAVAGRVGDDDFGRLVERDLASRGIDTRGVLRSADVGTSKSVIVPVVGEDRRFIHTFGANAAFTAEDLDDATLDASEVVYVGGYLILPGLREEDLAHRLSAARARGARIVLDIAVPSGQKLSLEAVSRLLPLADYFVPNVDEARALTGMSDPARQADCFVERGAQCVLIKLGERGVHVRSGVDAFELPAPAVEVVEPSGAGDAFAAGLIVGMLEGWELERCVRFASVIGASACTALGCWAGIPSRPEADEYLAEHSLPLRATTGARCR